MIEVLLAIICTTYGCYEDAIVMSCLSAMKLHLQFTLPAQRYVLRRCKLLQMALICWA